MDELEKYKKPDGTIDWGRKATDEFYASLEKPEKNILELENLHIFQLADELSDYIWEVVQKWDYFSKKTVGDQIVRSADSVGANIAEGYGRYFYGEYTVFLYYARGSLRETGYWAEKAKRRGLLTERDYRYIKERLEKLPKELNATIKNIKFQQKRSIKRW